MAADTETNPSPMRRLHRVAGSWFALTRDEQWAVLLVLGLFLLGLLARQVHVSRRGAPEPAPARQDALRTE